MIAETRKQIPMIRKNAKSIGSITILIIALLAVSNYATYKQMLEQVEKAQIQGLLGQAINLISVIAYEDGYGIQRAKEERGEMLYGALATLSFVEERSGVPIQFHLLAKEIVKYDSVYKDQLPDVFFSFYDKVLEKYPELN